MDSKVINIKFLQRKDGRIWFNERFEQTVIKILDEYGLENIPYSGEVIKISEKTISYRIGKIFFKTTRFSCVEGALRHLLLRQRYKNAWKISIFATQLGILVPKPILYSESLCFSVPWQSTYGIEYIENSVNVETYARGLVEQRLVNELNHLLSEISKAVYSLWSNNLYHRDLSGKNILTVDGSKVYIVDLDSVKILKVLPFKQKIKNLTQIYDSFCDYIEDELLKNCIFSLLPEYNLETKKKIYQTVKKLQMKRRMNHLQSLRKK